MPIESSQLFKIENILLHGQLRLACHSLLEGYAHVGNGVGMATRHNLKTDFETNGVACATRQNRLGRAEKPAHGV